MARAKPERAPMVLHKISHEDWKRIGERLFGADMRSWRFECPSCQHAQSHTEVKARAPAIGDTSGWIHYACEGRRNPGHGCDWTLGGLFRIHTLEVYAQGRLRPRFGSLIPTQTH